MLQNDCNMICLKHSLNTWQKQAVSEKPQNKREEGGEGDDSGGENGPSVLTLWLTKRVREDSNTVLLKSQEKLIFL